MLTPDQAADAFEDALKAAAENVAAEYLNLPMHTALPNNPGTTVQALTARLERVYCYELYHQIRLLMDSAPADTALGRAVRQGYRLNAEVDKRSNKTIDSDNVPDLLWHVAGDEHHNACVVEVKRAGAQHRSITKDVAKVSAFAATAAVASARRRAFSF